MKPDLEALYDEACNEDGELAPAAVQRTANGTEYLQEPGVALIASPSFLSPSPSLRLFLRGLDPEFERYVDDDDGTLGEGTALSKLAGQLCYLSFGEKRTKNAEAAKYFENILASGHGSVLEHPSYSFLFWGVSRSFTHELVRHRAGCAFSQVSQRYVNRPRFVERAEYQKDPQLHTRFEWWIDRVMSEYNERAERLMALQETDPLLSGESKTERRKKVNQSARECLPNETEAPIVFSGNVRALRHVIGMRASKHADTQIREVFYRLFLIMASQEPHLFQDAEVETLPDGTHGVTFRYPKV